MNVTFKLNTFDIPKYLDLSIKVILNKTILEWNSQLCLNGTKLHQ